MNKLLEYWRPIFNVEKEKAVYFEVLTTPNEKGMYKVVPSI